MILKEALQKILLDGRRLRSERYYEHCRVNHVKLDFQSSKDHNPPDISFRSHLYCDYSSSSSATVRTNDPSEK